MTSLRLGLALLLLSLPLVAAADGAPLLAAGGGGPGDLAGASLRMVAGLTGVLTLVVGAGWLLRRLRETTPGRSGLIEISSGISLGTREKVVLLRVGDEQILVGVTPAGMRTLHVLRADASPRFASLMEQDR